MAIKRISNTASLETLEATFQRTVMHPNIYEPMPIIDGAEEQSIPIIRGEQPKLITYGLWGLLPKLFKKDWYNYQNIYSSLQVTVKDLKKFKSSHTKEIIWPCLLIITGYFVYRYHKDDLIPFLVSVPGKQPFCVAGIGTTLNDGFHSCAMLTQNDYGLVRNIQNKYHQQPIILNKELYDDWLATDFEVSEMKQILKSNTPDTLAAYSVSKSFTKSPITMRSIQPVYYKDLPDFSY